MKWNSIKTAATLFIVVAFLAMIAIWGVFSYGNAKYQMERFYMVESSRVLQLAHQEYRDVIEQAERYLVRISREDGVRDGTADLERIQSFVRYGENLFYKSKTVKLALADGSYFQEPEVEVPESYDPQELLWYKNAVAANGKLVWSQPYLDYFDQRIVITVSQAVRSPMAVFQGVAAIDFDLHEMSRLVGHTGIGDRGYVMLLDSRGEIITNTDGLWLGERIFGDRFAQLAKAGEERQKVLIKGEPYEIMLKQIPKNGMYVATAVSMEEIQQKLWLSLLPVFLAGFLCLAVFASAAYVLTLRGMAWLDRLVSLMKKAQEGDYSVRAEISRYEEIQSLSAGFNRMMEGIRRRDAELIAAEEQVRRLAYYDTLTGLFNRRSLLDFLDRLLPERPGDKHAVIYIDLDNFNRL